MEKEITNPFFHCYSFKLCHFLQSQGIRYITKSKNKSNELTYFCFQKSDELNRAIEKWNELKGKSKTEEL